MERRHLATLGFVLGVLVVVGSLGYVSRLRAAPWPPEKALDFLHSRMELVRQKSGAYPLSGKAMALRQSRASLWLYFPSGLPVPPVDYEGGDAPPLPPGCVPAVTERDYTLCALSKDGRTLWRATPAGATKVEARP